jgi:hypothetical protein
MKGFSILPVVLLTLATAVSAPAAVSEQSPSQNAAAPQDNSTEDIPFILVELRGSLNAKRLKPGDTIKAQVTQDVLSHGKIVIPAESKLLGHVTEANARSEGTESRLGLVFDKVLLKHHGEMSLQGVVQAVAPPVPKTSREEEEDPMFPPLSLPGQNPSNSINSGPVIGNRGVSSRTRTNQQFPDARTTPGSTLPGSPIYLPNTNIQDTSAQNRSLSLGMRQGVFGLQGLSLSTENAGLTPGPVIVSKMSDVKLEYGTQVLLKINTPPTRP